MSKETLILTNCRNKAMLVLEMLELALKLEGEQQHDAIAAAQKGFAELNERMLKITPKEPNLFDPSADSQPRKRICYVIYDGSANIVFASWDEDHRDKAFTNLSAGDERLHASEMIVTVAEAKETALKKLDALDKLVVGLTSEPKKIVTRNS